MNLICVYLCESVVQRSFLRMLIKNRPHFQGLVARDLAKMVKAAIVPSYVLEY